MPITRITTNFTLSTEQQQMLCDAVHTLLQKVLGIKPYDRLIIIDPKPSGFFQPTNTTGDYLLFEISLFAGRSLETKRALYRDLVACAAQFGVDAQNVRILLNESPAENWGIRGGQAACDVDLGFNVTV